MNAEWLRQILTSVEKIIFIHNSYITNIIYSSPFHHYILRDMWSSPYIFSKGNKKGETTRLLLARHDTYCYRAYLVFQTILRRRKKKKKKVTLWTDFPFIRVRATFHYFKNPLHLNHTKCFLVRIYKIIGWPVPAIHLRPWCATVDFWELLCHLMWQTSSLAV